MFLFVRIETGESDSGTSGEAEEVRGSFLLGTGDAGAKAGLAGFSDIGDRVGMLGVDELRE